MTSLTTPAHSLPASVHQEGSQFDGNTYVSGGVLVQGNVVGLTINATASARTDYVGHYAHGSLHPVTTFVERPELREQIRKLLARDDSETYKKHQSNVVAVWGLGGMGKTQLVLDYLQHHRADYRATLWIEAGQKSTIERDFINIYRLLFDTPLSAGGDGQDRLTEAVLRVKSWFDQRNERWLFVFDGADSVDDPSHRGYLDLAQFIPESSTIDIVVTSRSQTVQELANRGGVSVGEMDRNQAVDLFYKASNLATPSVETKEEVKQVVDELGCLALAVNLAGRYVRETPRLRSDVSRYLVEYRQRRRELLQRKPTPQVHQYSESVLTTWETSFLAVQEQYPAAASLLTVLAFLSYDDIYLGLFGLDDEAMHRGHNDDNNIGQHSASWKTRLFPEEPVSLYMIEECFRLLERYSLVRWQKDQESYGMHRLVHAWGHDRLNTVEQEMYAAGSVELISDAISRCGSGPRDKMRLTPHIMTSFGMLSSADLKRTYPEDTLRQIQAMGVFLDGLGRWSDVSTLRMFILRIFINSFGEEHPDTIGAMSNLAKTLGDQGKLEAAATMNQEVLSKIQRILGEEYLNTIIATNNVASTLRNQGKLEEAATMQQEALSKIQLIHGEEHADTISVMSNLANTLGDQGKLEAAATMEQEVLSKRRRILGDDHPDTISAMSNLANTLAGQRKLEAAATIQQEVLSKRRRILGEEHPSTIKAISNLASTLKSQGKLEEAVTIQQEVLSKMQRILGEEHPDTIGVMSNLANALGEQGQFDEAAKMLQEVLEKRRRILGEEHPDTITAMNNLANTLGDQGQLDKAVALLEVAVPRMKRILGDEHPHTRIVSRNLARLSACTVPAPKSGARNNSKRSSWLSTLINGMFGRKDDVVVL